MLASMQLEVFTPLQNVPMTTEQIAEAIEVAPTRLEPQPARHINSIGDSHWVSRLTLSLLSLQPCLGG